MYMDLKSEIMRVPDDRESAEDIKTVWAGYQDTDSDFEDDSDDDMVEGGSDENGEDGTVSVLRY